MTPRAHIHLTADYTTASHNPPPPLPLLITLIPLQPTANSTPISASDHPRFEIRAPQVPNLPSIAAGLAALVVRLGPPYPPIHLSARLVAVVTASFVKAEGLELGLVVTWGVI